MKTYGLTKKEQIEFLEEKMNDCIKIVLENEVNLKVLQAQELKKPLSNELAKAKMQMGQSKEAYELKVRNYRTLIDLVEKGGFTI